MKYTVTLRENTYLNVAMTVEATTPKSAIQTVAALCERPVSALISICEEVSKA